MVSTTWKLSHGDNFQRLADVEQVLDTEQYTSKRKVTITASLAFRALNTSTILTDDKKTISFYVHRLVVITGCCSQNLSSSGTAALCCSFPIHAFSFQPYSKKKVSGERREESNRNILH